MKRIDYKLFTILFMILGLIFVSCSKDVDIKTQNEYEEKETYDEGSAIVKMFLPDYYGLAAEKDSRAIAPQTKYVRLSAYNNVSYEWNMLETIPVDSAEITPVENSPEGFPGSVYTFVFSKVYAKTYAKDSLKVDLLDSSKNLITSGTNATAVTVEYGKTATTTFYTLPCVLYNDYSEFNLLNGEMKFLRYNFAANEHCTLHIDVSGQKYPDVVVFNSDGTFADYIVVDNFEESRIEFLENENTIKYIGVWADDDEQISKCTINMYKDLQDFDFRDSSIGFWAGENYQINLTPIPSDAYLGAHVYTPDNENIKVSENGIITSDKECEGTVTVTCGQISHTIKVNVYETATELTGVLSGEKLTWTKENSPYKVTGNVLIEEGTELVIDPGVEVYFTGDYYIKMNGTINARGTKEEPIIITRAASFTGKWS